MTSADPAGAPESVLVVRLGAMGDIVHALWAVAALRTAFPEIRIGWAVEERWVELLCAKGSERSGPRGLSRPVVDSVHVVNTKAWRKSPISLSTWRYLRAGFREIRQQHYEIAADFQGAIKSALVARFAGAQITAGMEKPREGPARILYQRLCSTRGAHVIEQYRSLAEAIAARALAPARPEFPHDREAEASIAKRLVDSHGKLIIVSPGAGWAAKQWPAQSYGQVASSLAADGMQPLINFSSGERDLALAVEAASGGKAIPVSCTVGELIALTRRARLFIGGDSGPLHLAAALGVPVVAIFGPTDPARNGPYGTKNVVLRNPASGTSLSHVSIPDPGLLRIGPEAVIRAAHQLLESSHA